MVIWEKRAINKRENPLPLGDGLNSFTMCRVQARYMVRCEASILYEQVAKRIANIID